MRAWTSGQVIEAAGVFGNPLLGAGNGAAKTFVCAGWRAERRPTENGCAQVAEAEDGIPPPAVCVGVSREPVETPFDLRPEF